MVEQCRKGRGPLWATIHLLLTHFYDEFCFLFFVCDNFPIRSTPATDVIRCQSYKHSTTVIYDSNVAPNVKLIELTMTQRLQDCTLVVNNPHVPWIQIVKPKTHQEGELVRDWPKNTNLRGSITVHLTSCLFCVYSAALLMLN